MGEIKKTVILVDKAALGRMQPLLPRRWRCCAAERDGRSTARCAAAVTSAWFLMKPPLL